MNESMFVYSAPDGGGVAAADDRDGREREVREGSTLARRLEHHPHRVDVQRPERGSLVHLDPTALGLLVHDPLHFCGMRLDEDGYVVLAQQRDARRLRRDRHALLDEVEDVLATAVLVEICSHGAEVQHHRRRWQLLHRPREGESISQIPDPRELAVACRRGHDDGAATDAVILAPAADVPQPQALHERGVLRNA